MTKIQFNLLKEKLDEMETILSQNPNDPSEARRLLMNEVGILKYKVDLYSQQSMIRERQTSLDHVVILSIQVLQHTIKG